MVFLCDLGSSFFLLIGSFLLGFILYTCFVKLYSIHHSTKYWALQWQLFAYISSVDLYCAVIALKILYLIESNMYNCNSRCLN